MLVSMKEILDDARLNNYGVGMFNTFNIELAKGVMEAAEETKSPIIFGTAEGLLPCCDLETLVSFLKPMAEKTCVPVALHLDHGYTVEIIKQAIDLGFTSIMYDLSAKTFEENIKGCSEMVNYAHKFGVSVEAELGNVVFDKSLSDEEVAYKYTKPEEVEEFIARTGVDALAIAIGTQHGVYKTKPKLDIDRLCAIRAKTNTNLVLHGGSGLDEGQLKDCIANGIQKINIYTDIGIAACEEIVDTIQNKGKIIEEVSVRMRQVTKEVAKQKMVNFGSVGKA